MYWYVRMCKTIHADFYYFCPFIDVADYTAFQFVPFTFSNGAQAGDEQCHFTPVVDDDILEDSESFFVTLLSTEPAFLGSSSTQATVTINPDPADGTLSFKCVSINHMCTWTCIPKLLDNVFYAVHYNFIQRGNIG